MSKFAWVTLTTNDTYSLGALVLAHSLKRAGTAHQLAVLVTPGVSESMRNKLKDVYNVVQEVNVLDSEDAANLALLARPELGITFTKLHCWRLVQFEKCVFLDADTLVLQNCDELFEREELSAAPDVSWPDCFNSGVFVFKPSVETFGKITGFALEHGSFDGGDQGLLNSYFSDWAHTDIQKHLPFVYNVTAYASYCYLPAFKQFRDKIKILHFAGKMKPWLIHFNSESKTASTPTDYAHATDLIQLWWNIFCDNVHQKLTDQMNYWLGIMPRNNENQIYSFEQNYHNNNDNNNYYHEQYMQQQDHFLQKEQEQLQQQQHDQRQHQHQPTQYHFDLANIKDFRDPWEDYYANLENNINENNAYIEAEITDANEMRNEYVESEKLIDICNANEYRPPPTQKDVEENKIEIVENLQNTEIEYELGHETTPTVGDIAAFTIEAAVTLPAEYSSSNDIRSTNKEIQTASSREDSVETTVSQSTETYDTTSYSLSYNESCTENDDDDNEAGLAGALSQLRLGEQRTPEQEAYEELIRRQSWESGHVDYSGKDSFDNIWKKITETLDTKPSKEDDKSDRLLTSADIEDGKIEYDPVTKASTQYKLIDGGYEVHTTSPQPNGTIKTSVRTFFDPKPCTDEDLRQEAINKKLLKSRLNKEVRIDKNTTMLTRSIEGGYEEVYTTVNEDGTRSTRTKTFFDSVPEEVGYDNKQLAEKPKTSKKQQQITRKASIESTDSTESRKTTSKKNTKQESTYEESRRVTENVEYTENNRTVRKNSVQEQSVKAITQSSNTSDNKDTKKQIKKKGKSSIPPPPPDFIENDTTTVASKRVPGGVEYTYSTTLDSGSKITTTKTVYAEEETELTEEEIRVYKKTLKDAEKHKNVATPKKLRSESGTKKVVPSENPGDVTTVETIKIEGGTEFHYTTVTSEGIVKKAVKTVYDAVPCKANPDDTDEEEIIEEYEEEIIEPGEKNFRTIETVKQLPTKFEEEVTITHEKKEKKVKKSMVISH